MKCSDGKPCKTWFSSDGHLICRHGLASKGSYATPVDFVCPLEIQNTYELMKWKRFYDVLPKIKKNMIKVLIDNVLEEKES